MKKIPLLFLFLALFVGCENSATDMDLPTESSNVGLDELSAQDASGATSTFLLGNDNSVTGSWISSSKEVVLTAKYPVTETMIVDYYLGDGAYAKYYPMDNSFLMLTIPKGETTARAYIPDYTYAAPYTQVVILGVNPMPNFYNLLSGSWVNSSKEVVFTLSQPVRWTLTVDYYIVNPIGYRMYPTNGSPATITIPQGQTSAKVYLSDFEETQPPSTIYVSDVRFKYVY